MDIKPIETVYNGYRFRSRLEARWAVFFDEAGIRYEYETEGFELSSGRKYLPDFWLPDFGIYVEIKPILSHNDSTRKDVYENQEMLCSDFRDETGKAILLYRGNPWDDIWGFLYAFDVNDSGSAGASDYDARFVDVSTLWDKTSPVLMVNDTSMNRTICVTSDLNICNKYVVNAQMIMQHYPMYSAYQVLAEMTEFFDPNSLSVWDKAKLVSKQARFEYGETPKLGV
jgi:hypothetical protein